MSISLNNLHPAAGAHKERFDVGRGHGSGLGKTAGRGTKGQRARSGVSGLRLKGFRHLMLSMSKSRGFTSAQPKITEVTLEELNQNFKSGEKVTVDALVKKGVISAKGRVKVLNTGSLKNALSLVGLKCSAGARAAIEKAGGSVK